MAKKAAKKKAVKKPVKKTVKRKAAKKPKKVIALFPEAAFGPALRMIIRSTSGS